jgi:anti-sigma factor ChrR (cupin superfamily)
MDPHTHDEAEQQAALYASGAMPDDERRSFEAHLQSGCGLCAAEVAAFADVAALLAEAAPPRSPRPELRAAVLKGLEQTAADPILEKNGLRFVYPERLDWQDLGSSGIQAKLLGADERRSYHSLLVRMAPGAVYPAHRHADVEDLYLLEGDLTVSGVLMRAGDYCRAEAGSVHSGISTRGGCVFLTLASARDELIIDPPDSP